jgi:TPR repeat protein
VAYPNRRRLPTVCFLIKPPLVELSGRQRDKSKALVEDYCWKAKVAAMKPTLKPVFAALVVMACLAGPAAAGPLEDAAAADDKGDYATALQLLRPLAEQGNAEAQFKLGNQYDDGSGVAQNDAEALKWYRLAADQGYASAQYNLGVMYGEGRGVAPNDVEAAKWYGKAAEQGHAAAQYNLGIMHYTGQGVPQNVAEAAKWFRKAAGQGDAAAQYNLAVMLDKGQG